ncbi:SMI1/KNR4 family protein [Streptomyces pratens]|uniref:SMI1/KNR4 family protein n=1 Tax=Streptomyces pratens TaxID=887456 RepID=A0ABW1LZG7_9ACTN
MPCAHSSSAWKAPAPRPTHPAHEHRFKGSNRAPCPARRGGAAPALIRLAQYTPRTFAALEPPAERSAVAAAERAIGRPLPEQLTESLLRHNGPGHRNLLPPLWMLLDTKGIVDSWEPRTRIHDASDGAEEGDPEGEHGPWGHPLWTPFAADGVGDYRRAVVDETELDWTGRGDPLNIRDATV